MASHHHRFAADKKGIDLIETTLYTIKKGIIIYMYTINVTMHTVKVGGWVRDCKNLQVN